MTVTPGQREAPAAAAAYTDKCLRAGPCGPVPGRQAAGAGEGLAAPALPQWLGRVCHIAFLAWLALPSPRLVRM